MIGHAFTKTDLFGAGRFDMKHLLGKTCLLKVEHTEKEGVTRAKVTGLVAVPEGLPEPAQVTESLYFSLAPGDGRFYRLRLRLFGAVARSPRHCPRRQGTYCRSDNG